MQTGVDGLVLRWGQSWDCPQLVVEEVGMRSCSRIGILVAGWYLITPPFVGGNIDKKAPLSRWDEEADFTSLGDCSDERDRQLQGVTEELDEINAEYSRLSEPLFP